MSGKITKHNLFSPSRTKTESKAEQSDRTARGIVKAETAARDQKTARLRKARLEMEREMALKAPSEVPKKQKITRSKQRDRNAKL